MIVIVDYGLGNLTSVANALEKIKVKYKISTELEDIKNADKLILPGVGAFEQGMINLKERNLILTLNEEVLIKKKPILGICLGMQLMCKKSFEDGEFSGLGWFDTKVIKFNFNREKLRIPHVGWNDVFCDTNSPLFKGENEIQTFCFVHSYYPVPKDERLIVGRCNYGIDFCAVLQKGNIFAVQFHPEKSQSEGLRLLKKFAAL